MTQKTEKATRPLTNSDYVAKSRSKAIAEGATRRTIVFDREASATLDRLAAEWDMSPTAVLHRILKAQ